MKIRLLGVFVLLLAPALWGQKEVNLNSQPEKVTVFYEGAQIIQNGSVNLSSGRQFVVFKKLTDEIDEQSVRVKGKGNFTILSVKTRKNFEDQVSQNEELKALNDKKAALEGEINILQDKDEVYIFDETVIRANYKLKSEKQGIQIADLKEATSFFHAKMQEIKTARRSINDQIKTLVTKLNKVQQEIHARRSKPIINYSEVVVEIDAEAAGTGKFELTYISPAASWTPYYDLRATGINQPIKLEAKAKVRQNTGIDWDNIDLKLSTSNPYENAQEPILKPWYLYYNNYYYAPASTSYTKRNFTKDYSGQVIKGRVIDYETGNALPFCNVSISGTDKIVQTDFDGKFSIMVPENHNNISISFVGYNTFSSNITGAYMKVFLTSDVRSFNAISKNMKREDIQQAYVRGNRPESTAYYYIDGIKVRADSDLPKSAIEERSLSIGGVPANYGSAEDMMYENEQKNYRATNSYSAKKLEKAKYSSASIAHKDMRVEYQIDEKFSIPADGAEYGVNITSYNLQATFEYHSAPKIDPSVFLVAQVYGWEKYNLLNATTNLYFDGTYIGKSNIDVSTTKDTINFSLGKEKGISITRKKVEAMCKEKLLGNRKLEEFTYEIEVRNNSGSNIPLLIKDQFPISRVNDIKVKTGEYGTAVLDEKTGILLWRTQLEKGSKTSFQFNYSVEFENGKYLRLE